MTDPQWHGEPWNDSASDRLVIAIECDSDTEGDQWCWRVALDGTVVEAGREPTHYQAFFNVMRQGLHFDAWSHSVKEWDA